MFVKLGKKCVYIYDLFDFHLTYELHRTLCKLFVNSCLYHIFPSSLLSYRAKKKVRKAQQKQQFKINMEMLIPGDRPDIEYDENIFDITKIKSKKVSGHI